MRTRILCAIQYDATPAVTSIFSYPSCPNTTSDIEFTIILTLLCIFCNKIRYKGRVEMALSHLPKKECWSFKMKIPVFMQMLPKKLNQHFIIVLCGLIRDSIQLSLKRRMVIYQTKNWTWFVLLPPFILITFDLEFHVKMLDTTSEFSLKKPDFTTK